MRVARQNLGQAAAVVLLTLLVPAVFQAEAVERDPAAEIRDALLKSAVRIHRGVLEQQKVAGLHFWAPGYCVSTVGLDERTIREYIRRQEALETGQTELDFK